MDYTLMQETIKTIHPNIYVGALFKPVDTTKYKHAFQYNKKDGKKDGDADKVELARKLIEKNWGLDIYDLKEKIAELVDRIKKANIDVK